MTEEMRAGGRAFVESWRCVLLSYLRKDQTPRAGHGYGQVPFSVWLVAAFIHGPLFAFEQAYLCWWREALHLPWFPGVWAARAHNTVANWIETRAMWYRWVAPQIDGAIGFHWPCDGGEPPIVMPVLQDASMTAHIKWNGSEWSDATEETWTR
jgi:hypothetical protein